jgi:hypothetical protein
LTLIGALKAWMARPREDGDDLQNQNDPVVGEAIRLMREAPGQAWTVETFGRRIG